MAKALFIAEKPSVAAEFAKALDIGGTKRDGYIESENALVTWCVGHLVTMSYPEVYDPRYKRWSMETLPFIPEKFLYETIASTRKQFNIVSSLLNREDVDRIYVCTDSGREGEYIYRLVEQEAHVSGKKRLRVWIDSQTKEEILRGIKEAKDLSCYDNLSDAAYLRAKEDYLMGINFSRILTLQYGNAMASFLKEKYSVIAVGRVMTCVLGMVVRREREIRDFKETPYFRVLAEMGFYGGSINMEWRAVEGSGYFESPLLYKENGFKKKESAQALIEQLKGAAPNNEARVCSIEKKTEKKSAPLLFNLAELQNTCSKLFKISPDETLKIVQELYEKKLVTYPRTDARVLSTAISKEITKNIKGLLPLSSVNSFVSEILDGKLYQGIEKTKYVNDSKITDHYAIIPTGQGLGALKSAGALASKVYEVIVRRFLAIFLPPAVYEKLSLAAQRDSEKFFAGVKVRTKEGYLSVMGYSFKKTSDESSKSEAKGKNAGKEGNSYDDNPGEEQEINDVSLMNALKALKKGDVLNIEEYSIKEAATQPPKRYTSGSMILAMENAGNLIEDEELRSTIKGSGIGTSATRAEVIAKLVRNEYLRLNEKTQVITPGLRGEMIYDIVSVSIRQLLNPELTASWEKGLSMVAEGNVSEDEYMEKLSQFIAKNTNAVKNSAYTGSIKQYFMEAAKYYDRKEESGGEKYGRRKNRKPV